MLRGTDGIDDPARVFAEGVEIIGSGAAAARLLGVTQPTVWRWLKGRKPCPAEHVAVFSGATGIPRARVRPDLFAEKEPIQSTPSGTPA